jgi:siroheme synthase (precorrin-2 oxidase/ferrochelatase)
MRLIKLHIQLIRYVVKEINKKKPIKEHIKFFRALIPQYVKTMLQEFKNLLRIFDKDFREQKTKYDKMEKIKKDLQRALKMLRFIDAQMVKTGKNRHERKQFWRDFFKSAQVRTDVFDDLEKDLK